MQRSPDKTTAVKLLHKLCELHRSPMSFTTQSETLCKLTKDGKEWMGV